MKNVDLEVIYVCVSITPSSLIIIERELSGGRRKGIYNERISQVRYWHRDCNKIRMMIQTTICA